MRAQGGPPASRLRCLHVALLTGGVVLEGLGKEVGVGHVKMEVVLPLV